MGVGAAIIGSAIVGGASSKRAADKSAAAQSRAQESADAASAAQLALSEEQLNFQKEQYEDWQGIFGDTNETLGRYFSELSPDTFETLGINNIQQEFNSAKSNLEKSLAQKGITNSGITAEALTSLETANALAKADVRTSAPQKVAEAQQSFLGMGLGLESALGGGVSTALGNQASIYGNQAAGFQNQANIHSNNAAASEANIGSVIGQGVSSYLTYKQINGLA